MDTSRRDFRRQPSTHASLEGEVRAVRLPRALYGRRGKSSPRRVPSAVLEEVLRLYRERYFDLNIKHFHEKLTAEHGLSLSYTWTKGVLQGAGLIKRQPRRGSHRKRRERRPLPGMLLHIDASQHQWFCDERWHDLIVILDDSTSEIYEKGS